MGASSSTPQASTSANQQTPPPGCPMHQQADSLNPANNIPDLKQAPSPGQQTVLPLERSISSIPRSDRQAGASACPVKHETATTSSTSSSAKPEAATAGAAGSSNWEYPSPQQFYNALVRKGWETPEESVEIMVNIHNWLNEAAWQQVRTWEEKHPGGDRSSLAMFQGRPQELSPKARFHMFMGQLFPSRYATLRPFDRHDWVVHRPVAKPTDGYTAASSTQRYTSHRYVIDYYGLPDDKDGNPVFSLDVRPALDSVEAVQERLSFWWKNKKETWFGSAQPSPIVGVRVQEDR